MTHATARDLQNAYRLERIVGTPARWLVLLLGVLVMTTSDVSPFAGGLSAGWLVYAVVALLLTLALWVFSIQPAPWLFVAGYVADVVFVSYLISVSGGVSSPIFLLYGLLAMKAVVLAPALDIRAVWLPFVLGPLYIAVLWYTYGSPGFLRERNFLLNYLLLWGWILGGSLAAWYVLRWQRTAQALNDTLAQQEHDLAQKTAILQRTASDLGQRVLELRTLQEVMKSLASTLQMEQVLQLIVGRLANLLGLSHCAVAVLQRDEGRLLGSLTTDGGRTAPHPFEVPLSDEPATAAALAGEMPVTVLDAVSSPHTAQKQLFGDWGMRSCLIIPLMARQRPIGALYLGDSQPGVTLGESERQLATSFAYFATTAIENAQLYQETWEKGSELEAVVVGIGDGVIVTDPQLNLMLMNPAAASMCGLPFNLPGGMPLSLLIPSGPLVNLIEETLVHSQQPAVRELEMAAVDGRPRTYQAAASPMITTDGEVRGVVTVLRDITTRVELERMKTNFLSVVSHELKTPLHSIKGFVEIILMGKTGTINDLQKDFLETVREQTSQLQRLINDLLEFSRLEAGQVKLRLEPVAIGPLVTAVVAKMTPQAAAGSVQILNQVPADFPVIEADSMRIEQVITNLVDNAIKFTPPAGTITLSGTELANTIQLTVTDSGIGIPPEEHERIFDRFYQVDGGSSRLYKGTGLGLSICKHIIEHHGGRIWVESPTHNGGGASFSFVLPRTYTGGDAVLDFTTLPTAADPASLPARRLDTSATAPTTEGTT